MDGINLKDVRPNVKNPRSNFDLSFNRKFDTKFGQLYPFLCLPVMPSDKVNIGSDTLVRFAPFISQVFQRYIVATDYYYVPSRVVWSKFDNFMTAGYDGKQEYVLPSLSVDKLHGLFTLGSSANILNTIFDALDFSQDAYMNCDGLIINALPFFAYYRIILDYWLGVGMPLNKIYEQLMNEGDMFNLLLHYYGESSVEMGLCRIAAALQSGDPDIVIPEDDVNPATLFAPIPRLYPLDYFTEARPDPQLGPVMTIPLHLVNSDADGTQTFKLVNNASMSNSGFVAITTQQGSKEITVTDNNTGNRITVNGSVFNNVAAINDFYSAARVQELLNLYGFTGFMPQDTVAAEFGVKNSDSRLHRSQFLYHDQFDMSIGEVFSNNVNLGGQGQGGGEATDSIPGVGTAYSKGSGFSRGFDFNVPEHGYIFGLMSIYPEASYCQGFPRHLLQLDRFDYPHPLLSQLGMQEIKQGEIFAESTNHSWDETFAYTPRYSDYKVGINRVNGQLRASLKYMTAGRLFANDPVHGDVRDVRFNDSFLRVLPGYNELNKTFNVNSDLPHDAPIFVDIQNRIYANRPLPYYGLPKF